MKLHKLHYVARLPIAIGQAWDFFSSPANLSLITPPEMQFQVLSDLPDRIYGGMISIYRLRPMLGIPVGWVTEITHVDEPNLFVDEQRFGPYKFWHHEHSFRQVDGGVEIDDLIYYGLPMGSIGSLINLLVVRRQLKWVFEFRQRALEARFGRADSTSSD
ncbi:MAG TPA: SRPBCC family protein [Blastocatellia bacterium]|nr:SRPBCC family protein [Blastocatellia bacterium]